MRNGFVKIDKGILDSEISSDPVALGIFVYLACVANWSAFNGLEKGQAILSVNDIADRFDLSRRTIARRLAKLEQYGAISRARVGNVYIYRIEKFVDFSGPKQAEKKTVSMFDF